jgi:hypothetical protein
VRYIGLTALFNAMGAVVYAAKVCHNHYITNQASLLILLYELGP